jgi:hypothetical protein
MEVIAMSIDKQSLNNVKLGVDVNTFNFKKPTRCPIDLNSRNGAFVEI